MYNSNTLEKQPIISRSKTTAFNFLTSFFLSFSPQIRGDLSSFHLAYHVETVPSNQIRGGDLAISPLSRSATGHPIRHHLWLRRRERSPGQRQVLDKVEADRARVRDLDHSVFRTADDNHHRAVHTDRHQAATLESANRHRQQETSRT